MAGSEETARLLGRVSIFSGLTPEQLADLASVAVPRRWGAGEVIFREGDAGDTCYVVQDGCVRVTRNHTDGRTITLAELPLHHLEPALGVGVSRCTVGAPRGHG